MSKPSGRAKSQARQTISPTAIRFSPDLHAKLEAAAKEQGHGIGEEVRRRLNESFAFDQLPIETRRLLEIVRGLCVDEIGRWHRSTDLFDGLKEAIGYALEQAAPKDDSADVGTAPTGGVRGLLSGEQKEGTAGIRGLLSGAEAAAARENPRLFGQRAALKAMAAADSKLSKKRPTR